MIVKTEEALHNKKRFTSSLGATNTYFELDKIVKDNSALKVH